MKTIRNISCFFIILLYATTILAEDISKTSELKTIISTAIKDPYTYPLRIKDKYIVENITATNFDAHVFFSATHNLKKLPILDNYSANTLPENIFLTDNFITSALFSKEKEQSELLATPIFFDSENEWIIFVKSVNKLADFNLLSDQTDEHYNTLKADGTFRTDNIFKLSSLYAGVRINLPGEKLPNLLPYEFSQDLSYIYNDLFKLLAENPAADLPIEQIQSSLKTKFAKELSELLINTWKPNKCEARIKVKLLANILEDPAGKNICLTHSLVYKQCSLTDNSGNATFNLTVYNRPELSIKISSPDNYSPAEYQQTINCNNEEQIFYFSSEGVPFPSPTPSVSLIPNPTPTLIVTPSPTPSPSPIPPVNCDCEYRTISSCYNDSIGSCIGSADCKDIGNNTLLKKVANTTWQSQWYYTGNRNYEATYYDYFYLTTYLVPLDIQRQERLILSGDTWLFQYRYRAATPKVTHDLQNFVPSAWTTSATAVLNGKCPEEIELIGNCSNYPVARSPHRLIKFAKTSGSKQCSHSYCDNNSCKSKSGLGLDSCDTNQDCSHTVCNYQQNRCDIVPGQGDNQCSDFYDDCLGSDCQNGECYAIADNRYTYCQVFNCIISFPRKKCFSDLDCRHNECNPDNGECEVIKEPGLDTCNQNFGTTCWHNTCVEKSCQRVNSPGENTCYSNEHCAASPSPSPTGSYCPGCRYW